MPDSAAPASARSPAHPVPRKTAPPPASPAVPLPASIATFNNRSNVRRFSDDRLPHPASRSTTPGLIPAPPPTRNTPPSPGLALWTSDFWLFAHRFTNESTLHTAPGSTCSSMIRCLIACNVAAMRRVSRIFAPLTPASDTRKLSPHSPAQARRTTLHKAVPAHPATAGQYAFSSYRSATPQTPPPKSQTVPKRPSSCCDLADVGQASLRARRVDTGVADPACEVYTEGVPGSPGPCLVLAGGGGGGVVGGGGVWVRESVPEPLTSFPNLKPS